MSQQYSYGYGGYGAAYGYGQSNPAVASYGVQSYGQVRAPYAGQDSASYPQGYQRPAAPVAGAVPTPPTTGKSVPSSNASSYYSAQQAAAPPVPPTPPAPQAPPTPQAGYYMGTPYRAPSQPTYTPFYPSQSGTGATPPTAPPTATTAAAKISYPMYSQTSYTGGSSQTPYSGGSSQTPYSGSSSQTSYSGGSSQTSYSGGSSQTPYSGGSSQTPYSGGSSQTPYSGGSSQQHGFKPPSRAAVPTSSSGPAPPSYAPAIEQYAQRRVVGGGGAGGGATTSSFPSKKPSFQPPSPSQLFYCETCKISACSAGTYKTHLEGKLHRKKVQQLEDPPSPAPGTFSCELCQVVCNNKDTFDAHLRGAKHQKVVNLHRRLGKPIPKVTYPSGPTSSPQASPEQTVQMATPRITFVGGKMLSSTVKETNGKAEVPQKVYPPSAAPPTIPPDVAPAPPTSTASPAPPDTGPSTEAGEDSSSDPEPVGAELVVAVVNDPAFPHAKFKCTLCSCYFNDEYANRLHVKGRRHRLNFKKMYDPSLRIEPTKQQKKQSEARRRSVEQRKQPQLETGPVGGGEEGGGGGAGGGGGGGEPSAMRGGGGGRGRGRRATVEELRRQEAEELAKRNAAPLRGRRGRDLQGPYYMGGPPREEWVGPQGWLVEEGPYPHPGPMLPFSPPPPRGPPPPPHNPHDDRLVLKKHAAISPLDAELKALQVAVDDVEGVLKQVSDDLLAEVDSGETPKNESLRELMGVMRVGAFARGLMLRGELQVELVVMCTNKPTGTLMADITQRMEAKFEALTSDIVYNMTPQLARAAVLVISQIGDYAVTLTLTFTSTLMRDEPSPEQLEADREAGVLDRPSCLAALAALRHTKWFQSVAHGLPSCVLVTRVVKDTCRRVPAWGVLDPWMLELLMQKCIVSANPDFKKPGDIFRRVMECVASGIFLPGCTGLLDPCEKGMVDSAAVLSAQERANITLSAQHALRLIAYDKLHLVLGVDPPPPAGRSRSPGQEAPGRKRPEESPPEGEAKRPKLEVAPEGPGEGEGEGEAKRPSEEAAPEGEGQAKRTKLEDQ